MTPRAQKYLWDIQDAAAAVARFLEGKSFSDYQSDVLLRSAVERKLIIAGEATAALTRRSPEIAEQLTEYEQIIAFRNVLVHGYDDVNDDEVWDIIETKLPILVEEAQQMLNSLTNC